MAYLLDFLHNLKQRSPDAFGRIQYVEQPTARDLKAHPNDDVHEAAKIVPVVIDESLTGIDSFLLALKMGYSGAAIKACKGQSMSLLIAALAHEAKCLPVRARSHLPRRFAGTFGDAGGACAGRQRHRSQCAPVRSGGECRLG